MAREVAKFSAENLGDVIAAVADKKDLVDAIQASGHADFLADYVTNEKKRVEIGHLETAVWDTASDEATFQRILERNPWMFGGQYVAARPERNLVLGDQFDVPLVTADGSLHLVELKKANVSPLIRPQRKHWMVGGEIHAAVSQTQNYLRSLDEDRHRIKSEFGIDPRRLHATVVIGHIDQEKSPIPIETIYETIRTHNSHMTRITVMTYDQLVVHARNALEMLGAVDNPEQADSQADDASYEPPDDYYDGYERDPGDDDEPPFKLHRRILITFWGLASTFHRRERSPVVSARNVVRERARVNVERSCDLECLDDGSTCRQEYRQRHTSSHLTTPPPKWPDLKVQYRVLASIPWPVR